MEQGERIVRLGPPRRHVVLLGVYLVIWIAAAAGGQQTIVQHPEEEGVAVFFVSPKCWVQQECAFDLKLNGQLKSSTSALITCRSTDHSVTPGIAILQGLSHLPIMPRS